MRLSAGIRRSTIEGLRGTPVLWRTSFEGRSIGVGLHYVCGFIFSKSGDRVLLIKKVKPEWQRGYLNGVGGHVEPKESPVDAMVRETFEETEIRTVPPEWTHFARLLEQKNTWGVAVCVDFFFCNPLTFRKGSTNPILKRVGKDSPSGEGKLRMIQTKKLPKERTIPNLQWLIPLALNWERSINGRRYNGPILIREIEKG